MSIGKDRIFSVTDRGLKRPNNEDEAGYLTKDGFEVLLVADGMGGHSSGEVASRMAKDAILSILSDADCPANLHQAKRLLAKAVKAANAIIHRLSSRQAQFYGMGTTLVLALVLKDVTVIINCGDSRAYAFSQADGLKQLTTDQTVVQYLYKVGAISKDEIKTSPKRHVLMNALGIAGSVQYETIIIDNDYGWLLLCSDGLTNMVDDSRISQIISRSGHDSAEKAGQALLDEALLNGGIDNIAICIMEADGK